MGNFEVLQNHIADGTVRMVHVEAVPRSVSTALSRALNETEGPSVYVNEPFNRRKLDIQEASGHILEAVDPMLATLDEPLTVVTKNMSRNLSVPLFEEWVGACDAVAWSVRDPLVQMGSLVTRIANDLRYEPGADRITQDQLTEADFAAANEFLNNSAKSTGFDKTSWADMGAHFRSGATPARSAVIDGGRLTVAPATVLQTGSDRLGLRFSDRMISGWQGGFINANTGYNPNLSDAEHAWTGPAATSVGIIAVSRSPLDLDSMPAEMREHLTEVAMPVYDEMMASPYAVGA